MKRHRFLYALGYFIAGLFLMNFLYMFMYGSRTGATPLNTGTQLITIAYIIVTALANLIDKRKDKENNNG